MLYDLIALLPVILETGIETTELQSIIGIDKEACEAMRERYLEQDIWANCYLSNWRS